MDENIIATSGSVSGGFTYTNLPVIITCILGLCSNVLLLVAFITDPLKCFRNPGTYLVMNLSFCDCLTCFSASLYKSVTLTIGSHSIPFFLMIWFSVGSLLSITSISIDRFLMVAFPIKHRILLNTKSMVIWSVAIWIVSCILSVLMQFIVSGSEMIKDTIPLYYVIIIIPSAVMYASTYYKLNRQSRNMTLHNTNECRAQIIKILKEKQFLKTIIIIAFIAFFCTVPSLIFFYIHNSHISVNDILSSVLKETFNVIFFTNFAVNPLIYVVRLPNYRKTFCLLYYRNRS